ncbi:MAG: sporulation protein YlmC with PRC-barrel domain [Crocinitomicaceae bacterium]|jgi:sporulation protein YlmC with PRC-barrel domain
MKENHTKSAYSESWFRDGIVYQVIDPQVKKISLDIAKQLVADRTVAMTSLQAGARVYVVVNNALSVEKEAKKYYDTGVPYENITAIGMLMNNYVARLVGNVVFLFDKQPVPISFFNSQEKAIEWLRKQS